MSRSSASGYPYRSNVPLTLTVYSAASERVASRTAARGDGSPEIRGRAGRFPTMLLHACTRQCRRLLFVCIPRLQSSCPRACVPAPVRLRNEYPTVHGILVPPYIRQETSRVWDERAVTRRKCRLWNPRAPELPTAPPQIPLPSKILLSCGRAQPGQTPSMVQLHAISQIPFMLPWLTHHTRHRQLRSCRSLMVPLAASALRVHSPDSLLPPRRCG